MVYISDSENNYIHCMLTVASNVLQQKEHVLEGKSLSVQLHRPREKHERDDSQNRTSSGAKIKTIEVTA